MNNDIFSDFQNIQFFTPIFAFFADVSKKRKTRYLENGSIDFLDFFYTSLLLIERANLKLQFDIVLQHNVFQNDFPNRYSIQLMNLQT